MDTLGPAICPLSFFGRKLLAYRRQERKKQLRERKAIARALQFIQSSPLAVSLFPASYKLKVGEEGLESGLGANDVLTLNFVHVHL